VSYYRRPMGDYKTYGYAGDPGWLSKIWKVGKAVLKSFIGVPPKPIAVLPTIGAGAAAGMALAPYVGTQPATPFPSGYGATGPVGMGPQAQYSTTRGMVDGQLAVGYHWAKDGSGRPVRNRRMNVANPRALRKAMRRVQGFEKLAKRTISFTRRVKMKK